MKNVGRGAVLAAVVVLGAALSACGGGDAAGSGAEATDAAAAANTDGGSDAAAGGDGDYTIGVSLADQKSLFYIAEADGIKAKGEELGVEIVLLSADNDSGRQVSQVEDLITQGVDALIFTAQDATSAAAGVRAANEAGIPVIAVDQKPESGEGELATYIATDSVKAAYDLCTWMFDQMGGEGQIGILRGVLGSTAELQRSEGCQNALDETPGIEVVAEQSANWDETEGYNAAQNMLQANPELTAIFAESDAMALGAAKAARDADREIISVGIDGFPTMVDAIKEGLTQATQAQVPYVMGQKAVEDAITLIEGGEVPAEQYQDTVLVTSENAETVDPVQFYGPNV